MKLGEWIRWDGGAGRACPVSEGCVGAMMLRDGRVISFGLSGQAPASGWNWGGIGCAVDRQIVSYCITALADSRDGMVNVSITQSEGGDFTVAGDSHEAVTFHALPVVDTMPVTPLPAPKQMILTGDPAARKGLPICTGVLDYFPLAVAEVARVSKAGNDQHNPGQPLHWDRTKSLDHADCIPRHLIDRGSFDTDGMRHSAKLAWRALALLQTELENERSAA